MEHTPIPWEHCGRKGAPCGCGYIFGDSGGVYVAKILGLADKVDPVAKDPIRLANAAFIVRACNAHDELLRLCTTISARLEIEAQERVAAGQGNVFLLSGLREELRAAIAKARKGGD